MITPKQTIRINALVGLLNKHHPQELDELKLKNQEYAKILQPGRTLGSKKNLPMDSLGIEEGLELFVDVTIRGLKTASERVDPNIEKMKARLSKAKSLKLISQFIATITSVGLVSAILANMEREYTITTAVFNLGAVLCTLFATHLETPKYGGSGNLIEVYENLIKIKVEAQQLIRDLEVVKITLNMQDSDLVKQKISRANQIANEMLLAEKYL